MTTKTEAPRAGYPAGGLPAPRRWLALAVLCVSLLIVTLDNTVLNVVLPTLVRDLHATTSQLQWIVDAYVMVFAGLLLVAGSAADRIGRKRTFLAGLAAFAAGSTWAAFSGSVGVLIAARASMGIGAGLRVLPAAGAIAVIAPLSALLVRVAGTKLTAAAGMLTVAAGLWQISGATVASTYTSTLPGMILLGIGAGLVIPSGTASVMGSLPREHTGVGSATNGTFLQVGGALGVAVLGSLLATRYSGHITVALAPYHVPQAAMATILGSLGGALAVAAHLGGVLGAALAHLARMAFISGMDLAMVTGAAVALGGCLLALALLPARPAAGGEPLAGQRARHARGGVPARRPR
jgi:hypothetical protein